MTAIGRGNYLGADDALDIDGDPYDGEDDNERCSHCGGEWWAVECDDPIQCCDPHCDGQWHPCEACQGTGQARNQVFW